MGRKDLDLELGRPGQRKAVSERDYTPGSEKATSLPEISKLIFLRFFDFSTAKRYCLWSSSRGEFDFDIENS